MPKVIGILASTMSGIIGRKDGRLPWKIAADMKHFKERTIGNIVVMGRKTFESLGSKPLPQRYNIVVSQSNPRPELYRGPSDIIFFQHLDNALHHARMTAESDTDIFIIGGASIYSQTFYRWDEVYYTVLRDSCNTGGTVSISDFQVPMLGIFSWTPIETLTLPDNTQIGVILHGVRLPKEV